MYKLLLMSVAVVAFFVFGMQYFKEAINIAIYGDTTANVRFERSLDEIRHLPPYH